MSDTRDTDIRDGKPDDPMSGIHWDLDKSISYSQYLQLDKVLDAQEPLSASHDEMLFIVIHQATELWLKLALHELDAARSLIAKDELGPSFKMTARVSRIQAQLIQSWDVLSTLTPADYLVFRHLLGPSLRLPIAAISQARAPAWQPCRGEAPGVSPSAGGDGRARGRTARPTLYDEVLRLLARRGYAIDPRVLGRDSRAAYRADASVAQAWRDIYRVSGERWDLYELAEELVDIEDWLRSGGSATSRRSSGSSATSAARAARRASATSSAR